MVRWVEHLKICLLRPARTKMNLQLHFDDAHLLLPIPGIEFDVQLHYHTILVLIELIAPAVSNPAKYATVPAKIKIITSIGLTGTPAVLAASPLSPIE